MATPRDRLKDVGARIVQLLLLYISVFHLAPFLEPSAKWLGPIGVEIASVIVVGLLTETLIALVVSRPQVILTWHDGANPNPLKEIIVGSSNLSTGRAQYDFSVEARGGSSLGALAFWLARRRALRMRVEFPTAPVYMTVDLSTPLREKGKTVTEVRGTYGVEVLLDTKPTQPTWAWARLVLLPVPPIKYVTNRPFSIQVAFSTSTAFGNFCARVIKIRPTASTLVLHK